MKRGRPPVEGTTRTVTVKVLLTPQDAAAMDKKRGDDGRSEWIRRQIKRGLNDG